MDLRHPLHRAQCRVSTASISYSSLQSIGDRGSHSEQVHTLPAGGRSSSSSPAFRGCPVTIIRTLEDSFNLSNSSTRRASDATAPARSTSFPRLLGADFKPTMPLEIYSTPARSVVCWEAKWSSATTATPALRVTPCCSSNSRLREAGYGGADPTQHGQRRRRRHNIHQAAT